MCGSRFSTANGLEHKRKPVLPGRVNTESWWCPSVWQMYLLLSGNNTIRPGRSRRWLLGGMLRHSSQKLPDRRLGGPVGYRGSCEFAKQMDP